MVGGVVGGEEILRSPRRIENVQHHLVVASSRLAREETPTPIDYSRIKMDRNSQFNRQLPTSSQFSLKSKMNPLVRDNFFDTNFFIFNIFIIDERSLKTIVFIHSQTDDIDFILADFGHFFGCRRIGRTG
jgi:hypothetical protein